MNEVVTDSLVILKRNLIRFRRQQTQCIKRSCLVIIWISMRNLLHSL